MWHIYGSNSSLSPRHYHSGFARYVRLQPHKVTRQQIEAHYDFEMFAQAHVVSTKVSLVIETHHTFPAPAIYTHSWGLLPIDLLRVWVVRVAPA